MLVATYYHVWFIPLGCGREICLHFLDESNARRCYEAYNRVIPGRVFMRRMATDDDKWSGKITPSLCHES